jgi:hypothetical protein
MAGEDPSMDSYGVSSDMAGAYEQLEKDFQSVLQVIQASADLLFSS